jgi:hypothetical protein
MQYLREAIGHYEQALASVEPTGEVYYRLFQQNIGEAYARMPCRSGPMDGRADPRG